MQTCVLIGSEPNLAAQTMTVTANAVPAALATTAGPYYLYHDDAVLSLLDHLALVLTSHPQSPTIALYITTGGLVRLDVSGVPSPFNITWGTATDLRDLLGFTGNLSGALTYTATNPSPLLWIPRRTEIADARLGTLGDPVYDTAVGMTAGTGAPIATQHNVRLENAFQWRHVVNHPDVAELVRSTTGSQNGKWYTFHEQVVRRFARFFVYRGIEFTSGGTTAMTISTALPYALGPYCWRTNPGTIRYDAPREEAMRESYIHISLPVVLVDEYS